MDIFSKTGSKLGRFLNFDASVVKLASQSGFDSHMEHTRQLFWRVFKIVTFTGARFSSMDMITNVYRPTAARKKILVELLKEKYEAASNTQLGQKLRVLKEYWKVEMAPPKRNEIEQIKFDIKLVKQFFVTKAWKDLTVKQAWLLILVSLEIYLWFYLGETLGKGCFVGYKV